MERLFDEELNKLKEKLLRMAGIVEESVALSIEGLKDQKEELAREVIRREESVNLLDVEIDETCLRLLALRQPMAGDLRLITSAMKIGVDLERMGDLAVNIAQRTLELLKAPLLKPLIDIPRMAKLAQAMLKDAIQAFIDRNDALASEICKRDDAVDALENQIFRELLTYMIEDPASIWRAVGLLLVSRYLERIADHATNIAENVIYMVKGRMIKHNIDKIRSAGCDAV
jgi:phosphate transport system protein